MQHVPYRTSAAGNTDLLADRAKVAIDSFSITLPHIQSGVLRPLAYNTAQRHADFPDVPTFVEAAPGVAMLNAWQAPFFPRGIAPAALDGAARDILETIDTPAFAAKLPIGATPLVMGPGALAAYMRRDSDRLGRLVADIGLQPA